MSHKQQPRKGSVPASSIGTIGYCARSLALEERGTTIDSAARERMEDGTRKHDQMARMGTLQGKIFHAGLVLFAIGAALLALILAAR